MKFWPVAVNETLLSPCATVGGVMLLKMGAAGGDVTASGVLFDKHPDVTHGVGFAMTMGTDPIAATSAAATLTSSCVPLTKLTARAVPPTVAAAPVMKPVPVTRIVKPALPATTLGGERAEIAGVGLMLATVKALLVAPRVKPLLRKRRASYVPNVAGIVVVHVLVPPLPGKALTYAYGNT
jgi:hypothetical protein